jgi:two-component SAPR family response regulator
MAKRRVLIVEDDVHIALDLEAIVAKAIDVEVLLSRSVTRAKTLIERTVDLILLDVDVTNGKTFEAAAMLRIRQAPFMFLSGSRRDHIPHQLKDAPFIPKPYDERMLIEQIRTIISDGDKAA